VTKVLSSLLVSETYVDKMRVGSGPEYTIFRLRLDVGGLVDELGAVLIVGFALLVQVEDGAERLLASGKLDEAAALKGVACIFKHVKFFDDAKGREYFADVLLCEISVDVGAVKLRLLLLAVQIDNAKPFEFAIGISDLEATVKLRPVVILVVASLASRSV